MSFTRIDHIALSVESLRQAENFYTCLFGLEVLCREAPNEGWSALPVDTGWDEAEAAGIPLQCSLLGCEGFRLALCRGVPEHASQGRLNHICLCADAAEVCRLPEQAEELGCLIKVETPAHLIFEDPYGVCWEVTVSRCK